MRVYEAAKKYGVSSKDILDALVSLGHQVTTANCNVPPEAEPSLDARFPGGAGAEGPSRPESGVQDGIPSLLDLEPQAERVRINEEPSDEDGEDLGDGAEDPDDADDLDPERKENVKRVLRDRAKILLHTKIRKSQRPIEATRDAIRREIMMDKGKRFEKTVRAREQERQKKEKEEEDARLKAEAEAARKREEETARLKHHKKVDDARRQEVDEELEREMAAVEAARLAAAKAEEEEARARAAREAAEAAAAKEKEALAKEQPSTEQAPAKKIETRPVGILPPSIPRKAPMPARPVELPPAKPQEQDERAKEGRARRKKKGKHEGAQTSEGVRIMPEEEWNKKKTADRQRLREGAIPERPPRPRRPPTKPAAKKQSKFAWKREKRERLMAQQEETRKQVELAARTVRVNEATTVGDVARDLGVGPGEVIKKLIGMGMMVTIQQHLDVETVRVLADDYGFEVEESSLLEEGVLFEEEEDRPEDLLPRPPVVTIMGHVDHGKTKLLDAIRDSDIVAGEAGGITQHIGAYKVTLPSGGEVVFLDTPGHEAFTAMRARGTVVTDVVVLVVASNEGVMPQTLEALNHAKAAGVPILVAVNKIDLPDADPDRVKQQLSAYGLVPEEWGGKTMYLPISALKRLRISELLESLLLEAEILELKANPNKKAKGTIIESRLDKGRGPVATVLVEEGTLSLGDAFVTGVYSGRVRALINDHGDPVESAGPSTPVEVLGLEGVPQAGDPFHMVDSDREARDLSIKLQQIQRERELRRAQHVTLEDLYSQISQGRVKDLNIVVRGDVHGSVEALVDALLKIESGKVRINVIHSGVGAILESDVMLASASNALIIGFNVRPNPKVSDVARREHVEIRSYRIIYQAIEDIRSAMLGLVEKEFKEIVTGRVEVREVFRVSKVGPVAGCYVLSGKVVRNGKARILRDDVVIFDGTIDSLRRFRDDVREVQADYECGLSFDGFSQIQVGDIVECYQMEEVEVSL